MSTRSKDVKALKVNQAEASFRPKAASLKNQWELLKEVAKDPSIVAEPLRATLMEALQSQGSLAALEIPEKGIVAMSLNTQKALATEVVPGGYAALNDYRKAVLARMKSFKILADKPGRGTLDWYRNELADKTDKLDKITNEIAKMGQKLDDVLSVAHKMAVAAGKEAEFNKRRGEIIRKFDN